MSVIMNLIFPILNLSQKLGIFLPVVDDFVFNHLNHFWVDVFVSWILRFLYERAGEGGGRSIADERKECGKGRDT